MKKVLLFFLAVFFFIMKICVGQNFKEDLLMVRNANQNLTQYYVDISAHYFSEDNGTMPYSTEHIKFRKQGESFYYYLKGMDILVTNDKMISVDNKNKLIVCREISEEESNLIRKNNHLSNLDSLLSKVDSVVFLNKKESIVQYRIHHVADKIEYTDLYLDLSQKTISKVIYHYKEEGNELQFPKVILEFTLVPDQKVSKDLFSVDKYVSIVNKKYTTSPRYTGYHLNIISND